MGITLNNQTRADILIDRTYARPLDGDGKESWEQVGDRVINHQERLWDEAGGGPDISELSELQALHEKRQALLAGRTLWLGGTQYAYERPCCQFNCSYSSAQTVYDMVDLFWLLLNGCGDGFTPIPGTLHGYNKRLALIITPSLRSKSDKGRPNNHEFCKDGVWTIQVGDSAEAWAKALGKMLNPAPMSRDIHTLNIDFSQVRGPGGVLKGYGWTCNGWQPLANALEKTHHILNSKAGELLDELDILDILNHCGTVLSSRRSAEACLLSSFNPKIGEFIEAKRNILTTHPHRQQSNNAVVFWHWPSEAELVSWLERMWEDELGFVNGLAALNKAPWFQGFNPCLAGETLVATSKGLQSISDLEGKLETIRDGDGLVSPGLFQKTGENVPVLTLTLSDGSQYKATPYHQFVMVDGERLQLLDLAPGDELKPADIEGLFGSINRPTEAYIDGWLIGDGTKVNSHCRLDVYWPKYDHIPELEKAGLSFGLEDKARRRSATVKVPMPDKARVPKYVLQGNKKTVLSFVKGILQSDGHEGRTSKGLIVQVSSIHRGFLQEFQSLLRLLGVRSSIGLAQAAGKRRLPDGKGGNKDFDCVDCWRVNISNPARLYEHLDPSKVIRGSYKKELRIKVVSVTDEGERCDVYCAGVETTNSFDLSNIHSGNCFEILLASKGFCNLTETAIPNFNGDFNALLRALYIIARANYRQTCVNLNDGVLSPQWHQTNQALRLCGVSLCGIVQSPHLTDYQIRRMRDAAIQGANSMADELGLPRSKAVTTVKPGGTLPKVMGVTEGMTRPLGQHIFNWINFGIYDPAVDRLRSAGYTIKPNPHDPNNVLVNVPVKFDGLPSTRVGGETACDQLRRYLRWNRLWADHNVSNTISWDISERHEIAKLLHDNWMDFVAVAWLPRIDPTKKAEDLGYAYLPQEVVTKDQYNEYESTLRPLDSLGSTTELGTEESCPGGMCPVR